MRKLVQCSGFFMRSMPYKITVGAVRRGSGRLCTRRCKRLMMFHRLFKSYGMHQLLLLLQWLFW